MFKKTGKIILAAITLSGVAYAGEFNTQAEKDRIAMQEYFLEKFSDPLGKSSKYFPYVDKEEIKEKYIWPVKLEDFAHGTAAWYKPTKEQLAQINDFPPYEIPLDEGRELYNTAFANGKSYADCFEKPGVKHEYPYFDVERNEVITLGQAINECREANGETPLRYGKGDIAKIMAYMAYESRGEVINVEIPNEAAKQAYENGKKMFYKQRGYFSLNCVECHVDGSGQRIRAEALSPTLGQVTHFPVYRIKWGGLGTMQRRLAGCVRDTGVEKPKMQTKALKELEFFVTYMSNGFEINGPDTRK